VQDAERATENGVIVHAKGSETVGH
jgi:hypothetical protein